MNKKILSLVLAVVMLFSVNAGMSAYANDEADKSTSESSTTAKESEITKEEAQNLLETQRKELEKNIADTENKLLELEKTSKGTEEYIDTLDRKIGYINEQLTLLENENTTIQEDIDKLLPTIKKNEKELKALSDEVDATKKEIKKLQKKFNAVYETYCYRLRVMYISGDYSILSALLSSSDISGFLTRYEMVKSVSKSDTELLKEVKEKTEEIVNKQDGLNEKIEEYEATKEKLDLQKKTLDAKQRVIEENSETIAKNKATLATDRAESDAMLAKLNSENQQYTEFRNEDSELVEAVEKEIQDLISGIKSPDEVTTAKASGKKSSSSQVTISKAEVYSNSDAVLNMTYPVPGYTGISAGFPNYSSGKYHGGIDFPCPMGSKVVAAQNGIVITVKRLDYSYGYYIMIYHGTDSKGRSVITLYGHNSSILVSTGDTVKKGQQIAKSGSTGNSTGPHCHFELRFNTTRVNPKNYLG